MGKISDWVNRQRHNRGYGVQSPSEFFFVTQVLKEHLPYYAYPLLDEIATRNNVQAKHLKDLFRITNHYRPSSCIAIESPAIACAMTTARPLVSCYSISGKAIESRTNVLLNEYGCRLFNGSAPELLNEILKKEKSLGMLYIGNCIERTELLRIAMPYATGNSIIVIEGIHKDSLTEEWWQSVIEDPATIITYDMYSYGFILFNKERRKQHYTLKR